MTAIAVLLTNDDPSAFAKRYPDDGLKVVQLLQPLRPQWTFEVVSVKDGALPPAPEAFDGYVITGSPASVNDQALSWLPGLRQFIQEAHAVQKALIGLCFGHQAVAQALGGQVRRNTSGWGLGAGRTDWHSPAPWMQPQAPESWLLAAHNEQVTQMPPGARCLGSSDFCPVAAMQMGQHVFTTQFHPEMTRAFMHDLLVFLQDKLDTSTLAQARRSLQRPLHADHFALWMVQFFEHAWSQQP